MTKLFVIWKLEIGHWKLKKIFSTTPLVSLKFKKSQGLELYVNSYS